MRKKQNKNQLVTVIVPVYNIEKYVAQCIESIIKQTYTEIEIILVDDGSTDKSGVICDYYAQHDNRIHVIHKSNGGLSDARNHGLDIASGDYIMFVDGDDYIDERMAERLYSLAEGSKADVSVCGTMPVYETGNFGKSNGSFDGICSGEDVLKGNLALKHTVWDKLYRREIFDDLRFLVGKLHEDVFIYNAIFRKCKLVAGTTEALYYYCIRTGSITHSPWTISRMDHLEAYLYQSEDFVSMGGYEQQAISQLFVGLKFYAHERPLKISEDRKAYKMLANEYQNRVKRLIRKLFRSATFKEKIKMLLVYFDGYKGALVISAIGIIHSHLRNR